MILAKKKNFQGPAIASNIKIKMMKSFGKITPKRKRKKKKKKGIIRGVAERACFLVRATQKIDTILGTISIPRRTSRTVLLT